MLLAVREEPKTSRVLLLVERDKFAWVVTSTMRYGKMGKVVKQMNKWRASVVGVAEGVWA